MSLRTFKQHCRCLTFPDNKVGGTKLLAAVNGLTQVVQQGFSNVWTMGQHITIDESMITATGRVPCKQYMSGKPIPHGIKVFVLSDADSAMPVKFIIYPGKKHFVLENPNISFTLNIISKLLPTQCTSIQAKDNHGYVLYMDNYYTTLNSVTYLWNTFGIRVTGVCKVRSKKTEPSQALGTTAKHKASQEVAFPFSMSPKNLYDRLPLGWLRSTIMPLQHGGWLQATVFKDKKPVFFLDTAYHGHANPENVVSRKDKQGVKNKIKTSMAHEMYQSFYSGVDRLDRLVADFHVSRKAKRWQSRIFYWIVDVIGAACWIIIKRCGLINKYFKKEAKTKRRKAFQHAFAKELIDFGVRMMATEQGSPKKPRQATDDVGKMKRKSSRKNNQSEAEQSVESQAEESVTEHAEELFEAEKDNGGTATPSPNKRHIFRSLQKAQVCQVCQIQGRSKTKNSNRPKYTSKICTTCNIRICSDCQLYWSHEQQALSKPT